MTADTDTIVDAQPRDLNEPAPVKAGRLLRQAREAAGLHIAALAVTLKVPVAKIEALESGRIDELPDLVFTRALASSVSRVLKYDPTEVLGLLPASGALTPKAVVPMRPVAELPAAAATEQLRQASAAVQNQASLGTTHLGAPVKPAGQGVSRAALVGVGLLLLGALAVAFGPQAWQAAQVHLPQVTALFSSGSGTARAVRAELPPAQTNGGPMVAAPSGDVGASPISAATAPAAAPAGQSPSPSAAMASTPSSAAEAGAATASATTTGAAQVTAGAPAPAANVDNALVLFEPSGEVWVEVINARGVFLLRKTLQAGETTPVESVQLPLQVTVGRADSATVRVRGQAIDIVSKSRDNVARFEVK